MDRSRTRSLSRGRSPIRSNSPPRGGRSYSRNSRSITRSRSRTRSPVSDRSRSQTQSPVSRARSRSRSGSRGRSYSRSASPGIQSTKIVIEKLTKNVTEAHITEIFSRYGEIKKVDMPLNHQYNTNRGVCYVIYHSSSSAHAAIAHMHEGQLDGAVINVSIVIPRRSDPSASGSGPPVRRPPPGPRYRGQTGGRYRSPPRRPLLSPAVANNHGVDYLISFRFGSIAKEKAEAQFEKLISALDSVGLKTEARDGANGSILVFVTVRSEQKLIGEVYRSRVKDWLYGVRPAAPDKETQRSLDKEPLTEAERLRIVYQLITLPVGEGGAGITPKHGSWNLVESIFPLHDHDFNKAWLKNWSTTWIVSIEELEKLRDRFGEKIAFYFAFLQSYLSFLVIAAAIGVGAYILLPQYSPVFAISNCLWSVIFVEYWKRQEVDLAVRWSVRNVSQLQNKRAQFIHEKEVEDPVTGEVVKFFPAWKRLLRQILQIPFALGASCMLSALYAVVFAIEILLSEVYTGPLKSVLVFIPTGLLTLFVPILTSILTKIAARMTEFENYENEASQEAAMTQKIFVFNFICSYVPLFLTAFIYVPFGNLIVPHLDVFSPAVHPFTEGEEPVAPPVFRINTNRLRNQVIYFTVTAQIVDLALETIVPYVKRRVFRKAREFQNTRKGFENAGKADDDKDEEAFLKRARNEAELDEYDVYSDLREMCMQFGYLTLFSPVWPLASVSFLINNWVELRSDSVKICVEMKRPVPHRADSIGPWLDNLAFLSWMGSISSAVLIYLFSDSATTAGTPKDLTLWGVLTAVIFSEHIYFAIRLVVRTALSKLDSPGLLKERRERFLVRRRFLQESLGVDEETEIHDLEKIEYGSQAAPTGSNAFWVKQRGAKATIVAGKEIIESSLSKKTQ
ncbi:DUF590-domain-containing protein [Choiromyces venosus 120613-1]|uniref:DUF590-domain-containing protein n=1 Tax=Choiromyces venosus 120613-1 TaxID=1336337 RepID=A0A3N4J0M7_9PEZI|nr:DUF590-domain-containing protein [Choiromyces venosus 120613-1]